MSLTINGLPFSGVVKEATQENHKETEKLLLPRLNSIKSKQDYAAILRMFYGYFFPLENIIQASITPLQLHDIAERRNAGTILRDLASIQEAASGIMLCENLPAISSAAQAFGALYVMEGSTLGGKIIARMLLKNAAFPVPEDALHFFSGYRDDTGPKWKAFLEALNKQTAIEEITTSANETFFYLKSWMQHSFSNE
jgi:heme oxygenase